MPRRAALSVLNALTALLIAPDLSSDLALSHFSPSSHHPNSLSIAPKSPSHISLRVPMEPSCPAGTLHALHALQLTPATSQIALDLLSHLVPSHSPSPLTLLSSRVMMNPKAPMDPLAPQGRSTRSKRSIHAPDHSRAF